MDKRKVKKICHMTASHTKASSNDQPDMHEWRNMLSMYIGRETKRERERYEIDMRYACVYTMSYQSFQSLRKRGTLCTAHEQKWHLECGFLEERKLAEAGA